MTELYIVTWDIIENDVITTCEYNTLYRDQALDCIKNMQDHNAFLKRLESKEKYFNIQLITKKLDYHYSSSLELKTIRHEQYKAI